jgi:hypothetical protein
MTCTWFLRVWENKDGRAVMEDVIGVGPQAIWLRLAQLARFDLRDLTVEETMFVWTQ